MTFINVGRSWDDSRWYLKDRYDTLDRAVSMCKDGERTIETVWTYDGTSIGCSTGALERFVKDNIGYGILVQDILEYWNVESYDDGPLETICMNIMGCRAMFPAVASWLDDVFRDMEFLLVQDLDDLTEVTDGAFRVSYREVDG